MKWIKKCYSRLLIDNHITDLLPHFMTKFDPREYVRLVRLSGMEASMVYACDHNGNCYYPTKAGHTHGNLHGRDIFGETVAGLKEAGIVPVAYYTVIYHNDSAFRLPDCRMRDILGKDHDGRYHYCCPNAEKAVEFHERQMEEILAYPVEGIFIDMTFWPMVCCCGACREKYRETSGKEIPETVDWENPEWVKFQRFRENSLAAFAKRLSALVRKLRPEITVTHQFSPVLHGWYLGQSSGIAEASDYASGDFYGGILQQRLGVKVFDACSAQKPFEFMTSRCVTLCDHTSTKSEEELFLHALTTLANGGAYFFIDAIHPDGTLEESFYERLGKLSARLKPFEERIKALRPSLRAEAGVYFSMKSGIDEAQNHKNLRELSDPRGNMAHRENAVLDEILGTAEILTRCHIPYRIVTDRTRDFHSLKAIIVNNAGYLSEEECGRLREFVRNGGTLLATGRTSLFHPDGNGGKEFALADVLGVSFSGKRSDGTNYLSFGNSLISSEDRAPLATAGKDTKIFGKVVLPEFPVNDPVRYASIHSNPPGKETGFAGLTEHPFGKGLCVYLFSGLLGRRFHSQRTFGEQLFRKYLPAFLEASENLPGSVEVTLLESSDGNTLVFTIVNAQAELPPIPLHDVNIVLRLPEKFPVKELRRLSDGKSHPFRREKNLLSFTVPEIRAGEFFELKK
ncbi:MAG: Alpha-L-fucosidase [Lentisphaerae bacterium ADurb.Bin242]|nr:MAG: Alpha-L-fucosidase [Lentisphaerae bacterium ADurb.Bin242]